MSKASELYPLPREERIELVKATIASEAILAAVGLVLAFVLGGLTTGDWLGSLAFGWLADLGSKMTLSWAAFALPVIMVAIVIAIDKGGLRYSESYRRSKRELCQGLNGELPRMSNGEIVLCMSLAGVFEEFAFRYALIGVLLFAFAAFLPWVVAAVLAIAVSSVVFWSAHMQYRDPWTIALALSCGIVLGTGYILTSSLLSCMFAHAVYNIAILLIERRAMMKDPDYFGGKVPTSYVLDLKGSGPSEPEQQPPSQEDSPGRTP